MLDEIRVNLCIVSLATETQLPGAEAFDLSAASATEVIAPAFKNMAAQRDEWMPYHTDIGAVDFLGPVPRFQQTINAVLEDSWLYLEILVPFVQRFDLMVLRHTLPLYV